MCPKCVTGRRCAMDSDCESGACRGNTCRFSG
jgi:hypothetical protein